ncbi:MAG TPA: response regulator [Candidatus Hydrogenedentes bacterium]|nr:response regulator [Candidatus Hydrogenedentota bacterium]
MATILCIDPDEQYARHLCTHLKQGGYGCVYSKEGEKALSLAEKHKVDLVLSEVMMGSICGFEIARRIRSHEVLYMLPIILMSTMSEEDEVRHGYNQGVDAYLAKPVDPRVLLSCVAQRITEADAAQKHDPITGMYNSQKIKSGIQRAILSRLNFALVYIEMMNVPKFTQEHGVAIRDKAFRYMARLISNWAATATCSLFEAGHMGAGHFVCLIEPEKANAFCAELLEQWQEVLNKLYPSLSAKNDGLPDLSLILCATGSGSVGAYATHEYFDTLSQLRTKALASGESGLFLDKRRKF